MQNACSMLTGDVCRDGVMRRGVPSVRFAFRLVNLLAHCFLLLVLIIYMCLVNYCTIINEMLLFLGVARKL